MDSKKTIIVVDDNADIVAILSAILTSHGYNVTSARNGQELLESLEIQKPDLILLDVMMPKMDGLEALTWIKTNPSTSRIPVILVTVKREYEDVLLGYKLGAAYYISKPFTVSQLMKAVNSILGNRAVVRQLGPE